MKKAILLFILVSISNYTFAQFGITGGYRWNDAPNWQHYDDRDISPTEIIGNGYALGVDYWFRLKNYRIEFLPELNFSHFQNPDFDIAKLDVLSFYLNTNFYLFDFKGDCHCPTWSKQGTFAKKGFFAQVSPGVSYFQQKVTRGDQNADSNNLAVNIGAGVGFDIGITDLITFTPMVGVRYYPSVEWQSLSLFNSTGLESVKGTKSAITELYAGARIGFRFDYSGRRR